MVGFVILLVIVDKTLPIVSNSMLINSNVILEVTLLHLVYVSM